MNSSTRTNNRMMRKQNNFREKILERREHVRKAKWIRSTGKELDALEEALKVKIHLNSIRVTVKKVTNWKTPGHDGIHGYCLKKFSFIHDRLATERNRCLQEIEASE